jgi:hypothetical protein
MALLTGDAGAGGRMLAKVLTGAVVGLDGALVDVEVDVAPGGMPNFLAVAGSCGRRARLRGGGQLGVRARTRPAGSGATRTRLRRRQWTTGWIRTGWVSMPRRRKYTNGAAL